MPPDGFPPLLTAGWKLLLAGLSPLLLAEVWKDFHISFLPHMERGCAAALGLGVPRAECC